VFRLPRDAVHFQEPDCDLDLKVVKALGLRLHAEPA
jgi:hypothetical protein